MTHPIDTSTRSPDGYRNSGPVTARMTVVDRFGRTDSEAERFYPFEVADCGCGSGWVLAEGNGTTFTFRRFEFRTREGLNLTGRLLAIPDPGTTPFDARLSGERDIRIVLHGSSIEFRGHIEVGDSQDDFRMILTQTGGPDHGRVWTLFYDDGPG